MDQHLERVVDLVDPATQHLDDLTLDEARARLLPGTPEAVRGIGGSFALTAQAGTTMCMANAASSEPSDSDGRALRNSRHIPSMNKSPDPFYNLNDFVPSLREAVQCQPLDLNKLIIAGLPVKDLKQHPLPIPAGTDRHSLCLVAGQGFCLWETGSLRALFRGSQQPPLLGAYPEAYNGSFAVLDMHALEISKVFGDRRDLEMLEIYSTLRRRPDGKSLGFVHDYMWQAAAIVLGTRPLSQAEFEAIMARLERSCRTFAQGPTSRNYIAALRSTFDRPGG